MRRSHAQALLISFGLLLVAACNDSREVRTWKASDHAQPDEATQDSGHVKVDEKAPPPPPPAN